jgi:hypothetical protein
MPDLTFRSERRFFLHFALLFASAAGSALLIFACSPGDEAERSEQIRVRRGESLIQAALQLPPPINEDPHAAENSCLSCHGGIEFIRCSDTGMFREILALAEDSGTNNRCIVCHGGNPEVIRSQGMAEDSEEYRALTKRAHSGTIPYFEREGGPRDFYPDPGSPWINEHTCGQCHEWQVEVQWQSLMMTEAGKIQGTVWGFGGLTGYEHRWANYDVRDPRSWDEVKGTEAFKDYLKKLALKEPQVFVSEMKQVPRAPTSSAAVNEDPSLAAFTYIRGECQRCHLAVGGAERHGDWRGMGCSACHVPYANSGEYQGGDPTLQNSKPGRPLVHSIQSGIGATVSLGDQTWHGIPVETCTTCHNRGRRIGVSYQGLMETPYASPWNPHGGGPQQKLHGKHYLKLHADVHQEKGFLCQDCHTSLDVHGSGKLVGSIAGAVEIECTDCHGTPEKFPWELPLGHGDEYEEKQKTGPARGLSQELPDFMDAGDYPAVADGYLLSARGNPLGNAVRHGEKVRVHLASGAIRELAPLKFLEQEDLLSTKARVAMCQVDRHMERMECFACHATWAPQCYGCHIKVDYREKSAHEDWVEVGHRHLPNGLTGEYSEVTEGFRIPGKISESRSYLRWENPALGQNGEGRISPIVPGCQTTVTVVGEDGETIIANKIFRIPNVEGAGDEGQLAIDHSPLHPHTVRKEARSCESCHVSDKALGHGIEGGSHVADASKPYTIDLQTADGRVIPAQTNPQMNAIEGLEHDWSTFVTKDGQQVQTVGHHFKLSRPFSDEERERISREGVCLSCHASIPDGDLAIDLLHHVAEFSGQIPETADEHAALSSKILHLAAWVQVLGAFLAGALVILLLRRLFRG